MSSGEKYENHLVRELSEDYTMHLGSRFDDQEVTATFNGEYVCIAVKDDDGSGHCTLLTAQDLHDLDVAVRCNLDERKRQEFLMSRAGLFQKMLRSTEYHGPAVVKGDWWDDASAPVEIHYAKSKGYRYQVGVCAKHFLHDNGDTKPAWRYKQCDCFLPPDDWEPD